MDVYAENILDHYRHPRGKGKMDNPTISHTEINVSCGDEVTMELLLEDGKIQEVRWEGTGCALSQAGISMLSEELQGMNMEEAQKMDPQHIYDLFGVPVGARRTKCALLCIHTLKNALHTYKKEPTQGWAETSKGN